MLVGGFVKVDVFVGVVVWQLTVEAQVRTQLCWPCCGILIRGKITKKTKKATNTKNNMRNNNKNNTSKPNKAIENH